MSTEQTSSETKESPLEAIRYAYGTDVGKRREENQDSLGVIETQNLKFFLVADGMGGVKGGALASNMAVAAVREVLSGKADLTESEICEALGEANARIFEKGMEDSTLAGMGTTFVGLGFVGTKMYITSVGDSRAYRVRGSSIEQLTEDHTLVMELLRSGAINEEQAGNHPVSHMLTRSLGPTPSVEVDCWVCPDGPAAGDVYLLCSDGLYNLVGAEEFLEMIESSSLDDAVQELIDLANLRGGTDNITVMLVRVDESFPVSADEFLGEDIPNEDSIAEAVVTTHSSQDNAIPTSTDGVLVGKNGASDHASDHSVSENGNGSGARNGAASIVGDEEIKASVSLKEVKAKQGETERSTSERQGKTKSATQPQRTAKESTKADQSKAQAVTSVEQMRADPEKAATVSITARVIGALVLIAVAFFAGIYANQMSTPSQKSVRVSTPPVAAPAEVARVEGGILGGNLDSGFGTSAQQDNRELRAPGAVRAAVPNMGANMGAVGPNYHGLPPEEIARIVRRKQTLRESISELNQKVGSFDRPFSGKAGELLAESNRSTEELRSQLDNVRTEVDVATRRLSIWFGRRKRLDASNIVNLSTEVAVSSNLVREKKESFERATWAYLKEAEILRYNPNDREQDAKVAELIRARKARLDELYEEVKRAIDKEISEADRTITELNMRRDRIESDLESIRRDAEYVRVLTSGDANARAAKRRELEREREISLAELSELNQLLPEADEGLVTGNSSGPIEQR